MSSEDDPLLAEARAMVRRRDWAGARVALTSLVRHDPQNDAAIRLLLEVERRAQDDRFARAAADHEGLSVLPERWRVTRHEIGAVLAGLLFTGFALYYLVRGLSVGLDGTFLVTGRSGGTYPMTGRAALGTAALTALFGVPALWLGLRRFRRGSS